MNKQQLATKIWESANKMRSKIEANEYKDYILGFIFYKFLSEKEEKYLYDQGMKSGEISEILQEDNETIVKNVQQNLGYFISYDNLFSTWILKKNDFDVSNVRDALSAFNRLINKTHRKVFDGIFKTLETGLSKLGDSSKSQTKAIRDLIYLINDIPMDDRQDYDVLGFIYEYLISMFAANAGKKAGEFYTPHEVSLLMSEIIAEYLKDRKEISIYDPTSGSGSLLINIGKSVSKYMENPDRIKYYAQELKQNTYNLTRMNLVMRGILPDNIITRNGDTLEDDWPYFDDEHEYNPLFVDAVVSNPPYSQNWDPIDKENDPRFKKYGLAPKSKADYAFLLHDLFHLKSDGIMTIVLPHGVLFRGGEEKKIRKNLVESNNIDCIIGLPANIFFGTGIPTIIMVLKKKRDNTDIQIIDASKGFIKDGKNNKLRACDIKKIVDAVVDRKDIEKYSKIVSREEIRENDYNLNIPRYVDSSEEVESWDVYASMFGGIPNSEIDKLNIYWNELPNLKKDLFTPISEGYSKVSVEDIKQFIKEHNDVKNYIKKYKNGFNGLKDYLYKELIQNVNEINISSEENKICNELFKRLGNTALIDKYDIYQFWDNQWNMISVDIEIIRTEGFDSIKKVDPNIVTKKKNGKTEEVQDGWVGHIIPFEIVQENMYKDKLDSLKDKQDRVLEIDSKIDEILDSFSNEEKSDLQDILNENNDAFVSKELTKKAKELSAEKKLVDEDSIDFKIIKANKILNEEKKLKKDIKAETDDLQAKTKERIESLTNEEINSLLIIKWIDPIIDNIDELPIKLVNVITKKIKQLSSKYEDTFLDIESKIKETELELSSMIDELEGNEFDMKALEKFKLLLEGK